jgi:hypothetical protein
VLDCSGSMGIEAKIWNRSTPCKYHEATTAARRALARIPQGWFVSVFVFSHVQGPRAPGGQALREQPRDFQDWIEQFRPPKPWDPKESDMLMARLEEQCPWNETPLVRAIVRAREEGFPKEFAGPRTILVLTDGMDNCFQKDAELHQRHGTKSIGDFLHKEFDGKGITLKVAAYRVPAQEIDRLRQQMQNVIEKMNPPGDFRVINEAQKLSDLLPRLVVPEDKPMN